MAFTGKDIRAIFSIKDLERFNPGFIDYLNCKGAFDGDSASNTTKATSGGAPNNCFNPAIHPFFQHELFGSPDELENEGAFAQLSELKFIVDVARYFDESCIEVIAVESKRNTESNYVTILDKGKVAYHPNPHSGNWGVAVDELTNIGSFLYFVRNLNTGEVASGTVSVEMEPVVPGEELLFAEDIIINLKPKLPKVMEVDVSQFNPKFPELTIREIGYFDRKLFTNVEVAPDNPSALVFTLNQENCSWDCCGRETSVDYWLNGSDGMTKGTVFVNQLCDKITVQDIVIDFYGSVPNDIDINVQEYNNNFGIHLHYLQEVAEERGDNWIEEGQYVQIGYAFNLDSGYWDAETQQDRFMYHVLNQEGETASAYVIINKLGPVGSGSGSGWPGSGSGDYSGSGSGTDPDSGSGSNSDSNECCDKLAVTLWSTAAAEPVSGSGDGFKFYTSNSRTTQNDKSLFIANGESGMYFNPSRLIVQPDSASGMVQIFIDRQGNNGPIQVDVYINDGNYQGGAYIDYDKTPNHFVIPEGTSSVSIPVYIDGYWEANELIPVEFSFTNPEDNDEAYVYQTITFCQEYLGNQCFDRLEVNLSISDDGNDTISLAIYHPDVDRADVVNLGIYIMPEELMNAYMTGEFTPEEMEDPLLVHGFTGIEDFEIRLNRDEQIELGTLELTDPNNRYVIFTQVQSKHIENCNLCFSTFGAEYWDAEANGISMFLPKGSTETFVLGDNEQCVMPDDPGYEQPTFAPIFFYRNGAFISMNPVDDEEGDDYSQYGAYLKVTPIVGAGFGTPSEVTWQPGDLPPEGPVAFDMTETSPTDEYDIDAAFFIPELGWLFCGTFKGLIIPNDSSTDVLELPSTDDWCHGGESPFPLCGQQIDVDFLVDNGHFEMSILDGNPIYKTSITVTPINGGAPTSLGNELSDGIAFDLLATDPQGQYSMEIRVLNTVNGCSYCETVDLDLPNGITVTDFVTYNPQCGPSGNCDPDLAVSRQIYNGYFYMRMPDQSQFPDPFNVVVRITPNNTGDETLYFDTDVTEVAFPLNAIDPSNSYQLEISLIISDSCVYCLAEENFNLPIASVEGDVELGSISQTEDWCLSFPPPPSEFIGNTHRIALGIDTSSGNSFTIRNLGNTIHSYTISMLDSGGGNVGNFNGLSMPTNALEFESMNMLDATNTYDIDLTLNISGRTFVMVGVIELVPDQPEVVFPVYEIM